MTFRCPTCDQPIPPVIRPCATPGCHHSITVHELVQTVRPPRMRRGCSAYDYGQRCGCRQYTTAVEDG
jgi:hypothetical protein